MWATDQPPAKRLAMALVGATIGVLLGPYIGKQIPFISGAGYNAGAALTGTLSVVILNGMLDIFKDGALVNRWISKKVGGDNNERD